jgi:hypothetical protein
MLLHGIQRPLEATIIIPCILILDIIFIFLIDGIVGEVSKNTSLVLAVAAVFLCGKPYQALPVDVDSEGVIARDHHVDPQVEFVTVKKQGVVDVATHDAGLLARHEARLVNYEYTFAL